MLGPGDTIVVGDPAFPIHIYAPAMAGANVIRVPLGNDQAFLDRIERVFAELYPKPKLLILNYPHNPSAMTVEPWFWVKAIEMCRRHGVMIISDFAYGEICFDGYKAPSFLSAAGSKEIGVEFTTMSKSYNMAGWRIGFMVGNKDLVSALGRIKSYHDYGTFTPIQVASIAALEGPQECVDGIRREYQRRRDVLVRGLHEAGWMVEVPKASMYIWAEIPPPYQAMGSLEFAKKVLADAKVAISPGVGFGDYGDNHVRFALIENEHRIRQAVRGVKDMFKKDALLPRVAA
jgi:alanine-synthesizing transaminase